MAAIYLCQAKFPQNLGAIARLAACYGVENIWFSGERMERALAESERLPRELRMREYPRPRRVVNLERAITAEKRPIAVEIVEGAIPLPLFEHDGATAYVFGPEDGSLPPAILRQCHGFVQVDTDHCLSLPAAVATLLYDRHAKAITKGQP